MFEFVQNSLTIWDNNPIGRNCCKLNVQKILKKFKFHIWLLLYKGFTTVDKVLHTSYPYILTEISFVLPMFLQLIKTFQLPVFDGYFYYYLIILMSIRVNLRRFQIPVNQCIRLYIFASISMKVPSISLTMLNVRWLSQKPLLLTHPTQSFAINTRNICSILYYSL